MRELLLLLCYVTLSQAAPGSLRAIDWKNFSYPLLETGDVPSELRWMRLDAREAVTLVNGRYVEREGCGNDLMLCPLVTFDSVSYGALAGVKSSAAVVLTYHTGGTAHWQYVYVFARRPSKPLLLAWLRTGSRADQGLREVLITGGDLVVVVNDPVEQQGACCSAGTIAMRYRWTGDSFSQVGQPVYKTDPPSFDCAKAATPVERLICADAGLAFLDSQMSTSYRAALRGASAVRKDVIRRKQAEWFAEYSRTCNAPLADTERRDCIDRYLSDRLLTIWK